MDYIKIKNDLDAENIIQELRVLEEEQKRLVDICDAKIDEYNELKQKHIDSFKTKENDLLNALRGYTLNLPLKDSKTQSSYSLASAKLIIKKPTEKLVKDDEKVLIDAFKDTKFVKNEVVSSLAWAELKKTLSIDAGRVVDENGEIIEGVKVVSEPEGFTIKHII